MKCPFCGHPDSKVIDSRAGDEGIRRRRECLQCGLRFSTVERVQVTALMVVKRDGRREEFNRDKVMAGLQAACAKRPMGQGVIESLVDDIEGELQKLGRAEVPSSRLGEMVMDRLRKLDHVAYVRFASVYREFKDVVSFKQEIDALLEQPQGHKAAQRSARPATVTPLPVAEASAQLSLLPGASVTPVARRARKQRNAPQGAIADKEVLTQHQR